MNASQGEKETPLENKGCLSTTKKRNKTRKRKHNNKDQFVIVTSSDSRVATITSTRNTEKEADAASHYDHLPRFTAHSTDAPEPLAPCTLYSTSMISDTLDSMTLGSISPSISKRKFVTSSENSTKRTRHSNNIHDVSSPVPTSPTPLSLTPSSPVPSIATGILGILANVDERDIRVQNPPTTDTPPASPVLPPSPSIRGSKPIPRSPNLIPKSPKPEPSKWILGRDGSTFYNDRGFEICGFLNKNKRPCTRLGHCPFHSHLPKTSRVPLPSPSPSPPGTPNEVESDDSRRVPRKHVQGSDEPIEGISLDDIESELRRIPHRQGWTKEEHYRFLHGLEVYGKGQWTQIAQMVGTRNYAQVQSHAQKYYLRQQSPYKNKYSIHDLKLPERYQPKPCTPESEKVMQTLGNLNSLHQIIHENNANMLKTRTASEDLFWSRFQPTNNRHLCGDEELAELLFQDSPLELGENFQEYHPMLDLNSTTINPEPVGAHLEMTSERVECSSFITPSANAVPASPNIDLFPGTPNVSVPSTPNLSSSSTPASPFLNFYPNTPNLLETPNTPFEPPYPSPQLSSVVPGGSEFIFYTPATPPPSTKRTNSKKKLTQSSKSTPSSPYSPSVSYVNYNAIVASNLSSPHTPPQAYPSTPNSSAPPTPNITLDSPPSSPYIHIPNDHSHNVNPCISHVDSTHSTINESLPRTPIMYPSTPAASLPSTPSLTLDSPPTTPYINFPTSYISDSKPPIPSTSNIPTDVLPPITSYAYYDPNLPLISSLRAPTSFYQPITFSMTDIIDQSSVPCLSSSLLHLHEYTIAAPLDIYPTTISSPQCDSDPRSSSLPFSCPPSPKG